MTTPTDLPDAGEYLAPEFDDLALAILQRYMLEELGVEVEALAAETLLQLLRGHILTPLTATLATTAPTPYVVRLDALTLAVQRAAGCPGCSPLDPERDPSLELAPIYEALLKDAISAGTVPVELVDGNTEHDVDTAPPRTFLTLPVPVDSEADPVSGQHRTTVCSCGRVLSTCRCAAPNKATIVSDKPCMHQPVTEPAGD